MSFYLSEALNYLFHWVWLPLPILVIAIGCYYTIALRGIQFTKLYDALVLVFGKNQEEKAKGDVTHFQSLMTALAATLGIGNIAGVATAMTVGGYGAIVWMWFTAFIGMAIKYAEAMLAVKYREVDKKGEMCGGPMYVIGNRLGWRKVAAAFALFGAAASLGGGNILQANSVADVLEGAFAIDPLYSGIAVALFVALTLIGGIQSIGKVASVLVPFMAVLYVGSALIIIAMRIEHLPGFLAQMFEAALTGQAAVGGFAGAGVLTMLQVGTSRGMMTSEAGLGTASIAAAAAKTDEPCRQALVSMSGAFIATVVMCTITALVIGVTGVFGELNSRGGLLTGAGLTLKAFSSTLPGGALIVTISLILFAFTTLIGWAYYGEKCVEYLFGEKAVPFFRLLFIAVIIPGAVLELGVVWKLTDIANGLMAFPNLFGLMALGGVVVKDTQTYLSHLKPGTHQL